MIRLAYMVEITVAESVEEWMRYAARAAVTMVKSYSPATALLKINGSDSLRNTNDDLSAHRANVRKQLETKKG